MKALVAIAKLCTALRFLTVIPVSWRHEDDSDQFKDSVAYFPLVGLIIGGIGSLAVFLFSHFLPQPVLAALFVLYFGAISGFLHLDGLADSADGMLSGKPKEVSLIIMKDSRVGAMGVVAITTVLLVKYSALSSIPAESLAAALFIIPIAGRCSLLFCMGWLRYARQGEGIGMLFYSEKTRKSSLFSIAGFILFAVFFTPYSGVGVICAFFCINLLFCRFCNIRIGGATGDTLGAACELTEAGVATALTIMI